MIRQALVATLATTAMLGAVGGSTAAAPSSFVAVDLGSLGSVSNVMAVSRTGQFVGRHEGSSAFSWTQAGGLVDIGALLGVPSSRAVLVNDVGRVVGYTNDLADAWSWQAGDLVNLGSLGGSYMELRAMSNGGQVVGQSANHAFSWTSDGGMVDLHPLGGNFSGAWAVNESGQVVGSYYAAGETRAFLWTESGGMVDLGPGEAMDINDAGQVVGHYPSGDDHRAFSWTVAAGRVDLGALGGAVSPGPFPTTGRMLVNNAGQIAAEVVQRVGGRRRVLIWSEGGGPFDIGTLGGRQTLLRDLGEDGKVVGQSEVDTTSSRPHGFVWTQDDGMVDLGTPQGGGASIAYKVTGSGDVYGWSDEPLTPQGTELHATLWRFGSPMPPAPPSAPDLAPESDSGASDTDDVTRATALRFTGTAEPGTTVTLYRDATVAGESSADAVSGLWTVVDVGAPNGTFRYAATASNAAGDTSAASDPLVVAADRITPTLVVPADFAVDATSSGGAVVSFDVSASDDVDPAPTIVCAPASGTVFPIGDTAVTCTATDVAGNEAEASFVVHVRGAEEQLASLAAAVVGVGPGKSLAAKVDQALRALGAGDPATASSILEAFENEVAAQRGKRIPSDTADELIEAAARIRAVLA